MAKINPSKFETLAKKYYQFLIDDYGFTLRKEDEWSYSFEAPDVTVSLLVEHAAYLSVSLEPTGRAVGLLIHQDVDLRGVSVIVVSMCLDPSLVYKVARSGIYKYAGVNIPLELERQATLLRKYCDKFLRGDFSDWALIEECISKRREDILKL